MTFDEIAKKHAAELATFDGEMSDGLYEDFYEYYVSRNEMPYGVAKARDGDPYEWIAEKIDSVFGIGAPPYLSEEDLTKIRIEVWEAVIQIANDNKITD